MSKRWVLISMILIPLLGQMALDAEAAKKYYPPGFTPPKDTPSAGTLLEPAAPAPSPPVIIQNRQVIIKTVPVVKPVPKDPLQVLVEEHRFFEAMRLVDARLKKSPNNVSLLLMRGKILRKEGHYDQAITQYRSLMDKHRSKVTQASALGGLGWTYYRQALQEKQIGDQSGFQTSIQLAESSFRQSLQLAPRSAPDWAGLGQTMLATDHVKDAERAVQKAIQYGSGSIATQLAHAELLLAKDKPEEALQVLYPIKNSTTHNPEIFMLLARASLATNKVDDAIINLKQLLEIAPEQTGALMLLSQAYERKMQPEDAEATLMKAITLNPMDKKSVEALLKIYDQRKETERGVLLLKTLSKAQPEQAAYGLMLLKRLNDDARWEEAYQEGLLIIPPVLSNAEEPLEMRQAVVDAFAQSVYHKGKGMLDRRVLLEDQAVQNVQTFSRGNLQKLGENNGLLHRLNLLLVDPLASLPPLSTNFKPTDAELPLALKIAFLEGNQSLHAQLLSQPKTARQLVQIAQELYGIGDYAGVESLLSRALALQPTLAEAKALRQENINAQGKVQEQLISLDMLPKRIPQAYWEKAAGEALQLGAGNWKIHATVADVLEKRHQPMLALFHQKLAARYAPTEKDRQYWLRKVEKTARNQARYQLKTGFSG